VHPEIFGYPSWYVLWIFAAVVGTVINSLALRRIGLSATKIAILLGLTPVAAVLGAQLFYVLENGLPLRHLASSGGFRMPGGIIGLMVAFPLLCRLVGVRTLAALDAIAPGLAVVIAVGRIGCFLQGCCYGVPTDLPWGVTYPEGSPAQLTHRVQHLIPHEAATSLPVHPLALYFAIDAIAILMVLIWLRSRATYPGQVFLCFIVLRAWSKAGLELIRGYNVDSGPNRSGEMDFWLAIAATGLLLAVTIHRSIRKENGRRPMEAPPAYP
jgi:phosphatidylglycerol:prolipoprotein diacylglycerol transferase